MELHAPRARADAKRLLLRVGRREPFRRRRGIELERVREQRLEARRQDADDRILAARVGERELVEACLPLRGAADAAASRVRERLGAEADAEQRLLLRDPPPEQLLLLF